MVLSIQDTIRERLIELISNEGVSQKHISQKTDIAESSLCKFKKATYELRYSELERLQEFIKSRGY